MWLILNYDSHWIIIETTVTEVQETTEKVHILSMHGKVICVI